MNHYVFVVEGCDGVGKTTTVKGVKDLFEKESKYNVLSISPSNNDYGKRVKSILKDLDVCKETERLLQLGTFYEAEKTIRGFQKESEQKGLNSVVILDRWYDSFFVYQEFDQIVRLEEIYEFYQNHPIIDLIEVSGVFILTGSEKLILERLNARNEEKDKYENDERVKHTIANYKLASLLLEFRKDNMKTIEVDEAMSEEYVTQTVYDFFYDSIKDITKNKLPF